LTHISALTGARNRAGSYQRLEFLGDHVLGLVVSDMLFRAFAKADEGEMSRRLADLVRKEACADVARAIDLGDAIRLGASEANAGGRGRTAILADVCEALIGAGFVDGGYPAASALIERLWSERMRTPARPLRDSKTVLQEWAQARGLPTPAYREVERKGPDHDPEFRVTVELPHLAPAEGLGRSKRAAEQAAAAAMLTRAGGKADRLDGCPAGVPLAARFLVGAGGGRCPPRAGTRSSTDALRIYRADRSPQCRQVHADQRARRNQGRDRISQGADDARVAARHRDGRWRAACFHRYAGHFCAQAPARPGDGDECLGRRPRRRHRRRAGRRQ